MRIVDLIREKIELPFDLKAKYQYFNRLLFQGQLPDIPVTSKPIKTAAGVAKVKLNPNPSYVRNPVKVRLGLEDKYAGYTIKPGSMKIIIDSTFARDEQNVEAILIHEMIHIYFYTLGLFSENHGHKFYQKSQECAAIVGFPIPRTEAKTNMELTQGIQAKKVGVVLLTKKDGSHQFALIAPNKISESIATAHDRWEMMVLGGYGAKIQVYVVESPEWTKAALKYPIQCKYRQLGYYKMHDSKMVDELIRHGTLMWETKGQSRVNDIKENFKEQTHPVMLIEHAVQLRAKNGELFMLYHNPSKQKFKSLMGPEIDSRGLVNDRDLWMWDGWFAHHREIADHIGMIDAYLDTLLPVYLKPSGAFTWIRDEKLEGNPVLARYYGRDDFFMDTPARRMARNLK